MTTDLKTQIHDFAAEFASDLPPVDVESIISGTETDQMISLVPVPKRRWPTWAPAAVAAFLTIVVIGGAALLFANPEDNDVADPITVPTVVEDITPDPSPPTTVLPDAAEPSATITGISWKQVTPNGIDPIADVVPGLFSTGDRFVYVHGSTGAISTSFDGLTWTKQVIADLPPDASNFVGWKDTMVWWGCEFGIDPSPDSEPDQGCVSIVEPSGTVVIEVFESSVTAVGVGPAGVVISVANHFDESGLQYEHEDEIVESLTGQDITAYAVVDINDGVLHLESNDGQVSDYVLADEGYTSDPPAASGWFSTNGEEWTPIAGFPDDDELQLIGTDDGFVGVSATSVWHSANGQDWRELGQTPGNPSTLSRWNDGAIVTGTESIWYLSAFGIDEMTLSTTGLGLSASGDVGLVIIDTGAGGEAQELNQILYSPNGQEWASTDLPAEMRGIELTGGWFSSMAVATDQGVLLLLFEASDNEYGQAPVWFLGTPTTG